MTGADGPPLDSVLAAFSPAGDTLALSSGDGRVKAWDVTSGHVCAYLTPKSRPTVTDTAAGEAGGPLGLHLAVLAWGAADVGKAAKKKKSRSAPLLAAASRSGSILAWDIALGELRWRSDAAHTGAAEALAFAPGGAVLYSGGSDGQVCQLEAATGAVVARERLERHGVAALAVSPDGAQLLVASSRIRLIDLASMRKLRKFAGHAACVRALAFSPDGHYGLSAAAGDRSVAVWDLVGGAREGGGEARAVALLPLEEPALSLSCSRGEGGEGVTIVALAQAGEAYVWRGADVLAAAGGKATHIRVGRRGHTQPVLAAHALPGGSVLLAHGSAASPHFETVLAGALVGGQVELSPSAKGALLPAAEQTQEQAHSQQGAAVVLGLETGAAGPAAALHRREARLSKASKRKAGGEGDSPEPSGSGRTGEGAEPMAEEAGRAAGGRETLGERVAALELDGGAGARGGGGGAAAGPGSVAPRAHSLQVLLTQALASSDGQLLEKCLAIGDEKVIRNTLRRMRPGDDAALLSTLTAKLQAKPSRGPLLLPWIRALLLQHAGSLMAAPGAQASLLSLHQLIEARLAVFQPLLALSGRLDLLMAQIAPFEETFQHQAAPDDVAPSTAVYEEGHSDEEGADAVEDVAAMESDGSESGREEDADADDMEGADDGEWETDLEGEDLEGGAV